MGSIQIESSGQTPGATGMSTLRVLLIGDDPDDQRIVKDLVEEQSAISCDVATSFHEGYEAIRSRRHDAYLVDLRLGGESGIDLVNQLAREASGPMVLLTGVQNGDADALALEAGAADFLVKDGLSRELVQRSLRYSVEKWRERQRAEEGYTKYRSLFDGVPVGLFRIDRNGIFIEVNATAVRKLGYDDQTDVVGRSIQEILAEDQPPDAPILSGATEGELHLKTRDGGSCWVRVSLETVRDGVGAVLHFEGAALDITEQKEAERELRRYRELTAAAYDASAVGKAIVSLPEGRLVSANKALCEFLGYERDALVGEHFATVTHPEDLGADASQFQRLIEAGTGSYTMDKRYLRADGAVVWGRLQVSVIEGDQGVEYVLGEVVDITEEKRAEERVAFQAYLFQQMRTPVVATDRRGVVTHWNHQAEIAYGWTADEAMGQDFVELVLPELDPLELEGMQSDFRERGLWEGELLITRKDGSTFLAWSSGAVVRDSAGRAKGVVGAIVDLTDVNKARAEALAQEMLSRSLLEAVNMPVAILDEEGEVVASNPSWQSGEGARAHPYLPCTLDDVPEPQVAEAIAAGVEDVVQGGQDRFSMEYACASADGERWMRAAVVPAEGGGAVVSHWDITNERFAREALEENLRAKDEFITSVSHELRTPLSVIVGLSETLRSGTHSAGEASEFYALIADQSQEMALIVEDLLVAGRIDSDTLTVREDMVDLEEEIETVLRPFGEKEVEVGVRLIPGAEKIYADALRVRQILRNLVTNAVKYGEPPVWIKAVRARGQVIVGVSDHGEGVPESALEKMFQPYSRFGADDGQPSSVGLGLHVSRRLARLMAGDLEYKRESEKTAFLLSLPAESPDRSDLAGDAMKLLRL